MNNSGIIYTGMQYSAMLIILAGLTSIPTDPFESAMIDGANRWQTLTKITLPLLSMAYRLPESPLCQSLFSC